jgi:hypothetical protein
MQLQPARLAMVLALAAVSIPGFAASAPERVAASDDATPEAETVVDDEDGGVEAYQRNEIAVYDALISDPAPRIQALASRIYIEDSDETPTALRPKREDVLARAAQFAPDDVLVQWIAVSQGSFMSSSCGPTHWPEAEVANLLRLEPDNAAAWQYGVALARAKGDEAGVDDALSRMAAARRADDHLTDELGAWTVALHAHSDVAELSIPPWFDQDVTPKQGALIAGLQRTGYRYSAAESALEDVCKPDAASDRTWQRLGWCADAARLLAQKGSSLELREQGLKLLATIGERSDAIEPLQRQYDWFEVHSANPLRGFQEPPDSADVVVADWQDAASEVAAIERHLRHLGLPSTPPESWSREVSLEAADDAPDAESTDRMTKLNADYMKAVFEDMRTSPNAEQRVMTALFGKLMGDAGSMTADDDATATVGAPKTTTEDFAALAEGNPGNLKVQWMIATSADPRISDDTKAGAIARMQVAESDNAAVWALSLPIKGDGSGDILDATLQHMAASARYDTHALDAATAMVDAMTRRPVPDELVELWSKQSTYFDFSPELSARVMGLAIAAAMTSSVGTSLIRTCAPGANAAVGSRRDACLATARTMLDKSTTMMGVSFGESILRKLDALDAASATRARNAAWWQQQSMDSAMNGELAAYLDDYFTTGNELEAMRLNAERLGKAEPPANWKSPNERKAARAASK